MKYLFFFVFLLVASVAAVALFLFVGGAEPAPDILWGVTFGHSQAISLGADWRETYGALLDDLNVRRFRIPIYWDELEPSPGVYDFSPWDWQLDELSRRKGTSIVAVGRKLPRWPECRMPEWAKTLPREEQREAILSMIERVVTHFKDHPAIWAWQVENEPFLSFGICPKSDEELLDREIALVRKLDPSRPVIITDTGEFSAWLRAGNRADIVGSTLYRVIHDPVFGFIRYPFPPVMYHRKTQWLGWWHPETRVIFTEVQAEPWVVDPPISRYPLDVQFSTMNADRFRENILFAEQTGFDEMYLWGAEWWYWLKTQGHPEIWEEARRVFHQ